MVGVVVGPGDVGGLAVAPKRDRARSEVIARSVEVGVGCESESLGVLGGSEHEVADKFNRRGVGRHVIAAEDAVGESACR